MSFVRQRHPQRQNSWCLLLSGGDSTEGDAGQASPVSADASETLHQPLEHAECGGVRRGAGEHGRARTESRGWCKKLRSVRAHFGGWSTMPAPGHFGTAFKEYVADYDADDDEVTVEGELEAEESEVDE